jgi:uncharacterized protein YbjT (DUF2867 family)
MRILVTGATGYVRSWLVTALLADRPEVVATSRDPQRLKRLGWSADVTPVHAAVRVNGVATASLVAAMANLVPGPLACAVRTGLDMLIALSPKVRPA